MVWLCSHQTLCQGTLQESHFKKLRVVDTKPLATDVLGRWWHRRELQKGSTFSDVRFEFGLCIADVIKLRWHRVWNQLWLALKTVCPWDNVARQIAWFALGPVEAFLWNLKPNGRSHEILQPSWIHWGAASPVWLFGPLAPLRPAKGRKMRSEQLRRFRRFLIWKLVLSKIVWAATRRAYIRCERIGCSWTMSALFLHAVRWTGCVYVWHLFRGATCTR